MNFSAITLIRKRQHKTNGKLMSRDMVHLLEIQQWVPNEFYFKNHGRYYHYYSINVIKFIK